MKLMLMFFKDIALLKIESLWQFILIIFSVPLWGKGSLSLTKALFHNSIANGHRNQGVKGKGILIGERYLSALS